MKPGPLVLLALSTVLSGSCAFTFATSAGMDGTVRLGAPLTGERRAASAKVRSFRAGLSATYIARLTLYGESVVADGWQVEAPSSVGRTQATLFGAELGVPVLLPWVLATQPMELESHFSRSLFVTAGLAGGSEGSERHVGLELNADLGLGAVYVGGARNWIDLDVGTAVASGHAELEGWSFEVGLALPGDLVLFREILEALSVGFY